MLARLSSIAGVVSSRVDVTGRTFVVDVAAVGSRDRIVEEIGRVLGPGSRSLGEPWGSAESGRLDADDCLWLDLGSIRRLSLIEARMLSTNWGRSAAAAAALGPDSADHLTMALCRELEGEFERVHARGGARDRRWYVEVFPGACERAIAALSGEITPAQASAIRDLLSAQIRQAVSGAET